jgi:beta-glucosidase
LVLLAFSPASCSVDRSGVETDTQAWPEHVRQPHRPHDVDPLVGSRVDELLSAMSLEEKTKLLHGATVLDLHDLPRLNIPSLKLADGPLGIRWEKATAFPCPLAMAATWDVELVQRVGVAFGKEWRNKGRQVWLGPCVNIVRVPHGGRNFETYGEDPYLNSRMAVAAIRGAQSQNVIACVKHFACNNQEFERHTINIEVDERALREIYLPAFKAAVQEGGAWAVMAAYNRLNGPYCAENRRLLVEILKQEWGFDGFVVSDWGAVHDTDAAANAGLDLEMDLANPVGAYWGEGKLLAACREGRVSEQAIDDKVRRLLRAMFFTGVMKRSWDEPDREITEHRTLARQVAQAGIVLLKNERNLLPLDPSRAQTIAVIGPASREARLGGGGSSVVTPHRAVGPLEGLEDVVGQDVTLLSVAGVTAVGALPQAVETAWLTPPSGEGHGLLGEYFDNEELEGEPVVRRIDPTIHFEWGWNSPGDGIPSDRFSVRWRGTLTVPKSGAFELGMATDDGFRLLIDGNLHINDWTEHSTRLLTRPVQLEAGRPYQLTVEFYEHSGAAVAALACFQKDVALGAAVTAARRADAALIFVGLSASIESEGFDRESINLDKDQVALIRQVATANPKTAVIVIAGSQVGMDEWVNDVPAIVQAWYPGQEGGDAIADVLFGKANPSGKLPMTFIKRWEDHPAFENYPGGRYTEGLYVGYRHFDKHGIEPLFAFGHGRSYTSFEYANLEVDTSRVGHDGSVNVTLDVANTGNTAGAEVVQVYVRDAASTVDRPDRELKGFAKIRLDPEQRQRVTITLDRSAFAYYDVGRSAWHVEPGQFEILVGSSSRDIRARATINYP